MPALLDCPDPGCWHALFNGSISPDEGEFYVRHLESCSSCQSRLDRAEECEDELRRLGRQVGDPTSLDVDPGLSHVVERLQEEGPASASTEPIDLYFLRPSDRPGVLGTLGAYEVREVIGQGGMGIVLKAYEPALDRLVAIKVMAANVVGNATARQRFTREARSAAGVCHENIVPLHGVYDLDGLPYLVMQCVRGESLQARLDRGGPLEQRDIVDIGLQTARGLAAAHAQGIVHRDIKPANLLLVSGRVVSGEWSEGITTYHPPLTTHHSPLLVKITDFGLARMVDDAQLTQLGVVSGTPEYMSPEQARGESVDHRSDLFSLGSVLYTLCTGAPPFSAFSPLAVLQLVSDKTPSPIRSLNPDVPPWLEAFIVRLMAKNPADRFQSAAEVVELLEGYHAHLRQPMTIPLPQIDELHTGIGRARDKKGRERSSGRRRRRSGLLVLLLVALFGMVGWITLAQLQPGRGEPLSEGIYQDFRGGQGLRPPFVPVGGDAEAFTRAENGGLRITVPADRGNTNRVGIELYSRVKGDFEITTSFEILKCVQPTAGNGVGIELFVATDPSDTELGLFRASRVNEGEVYMSSMCPMVNGKRRYQLRFEPATIKAGRLRITRVGRLATLWAAPGDANEFEELFTEDLGSDDLKQIRVAAFLGHAPNEVDLRIKDVRIRSLHPIETAALTAASEKLQSERNKVWMIAAGVVGLTTIVIGLVVWLFVRRRRQADNRTSDDSEQAKPDALPASVSFACPGCQRTLKARPALAGKKVKCPQCGDSVNVPSIQANVPPAPDTAKSGKVSRARGWWGAVLALVFLLVLGGLGWSLRSPMKKEFHSVAARLVRHERSVWWARFLPDGRTVVSGGEDRSIRLWNVGGAE